MKNRSVVSLLGVSGLRAVYRDLCSGYMGQY